MPDTTEPAAAQLPLKRAETAAAFVLIVQIVASAVAMGLALAFKSQAALAEAWHLMLGIAVWTVALIHQRFRRLADEEAHEVASLRASRERDASSSLFEEEQQLDLALHRNRLESFVKYFLPTFAIGLVLALGWLSYALLSRVATLTEPPEIGEPLLQTAIFVIGMAFVFFLLGRYTGGLATHAPWRPIRAGASYSLSNAVGCLLVGVALLCDHVDLKWVEPVVAYIIPSVLALMALEILLNQMLAIYRPKVAGQERRAAYDSRLLGMLTESQGLIRTAADTLDYQFGFKVSDTWFFRFMSRVIVPLVLFQAVTLYLLTCFVIVNTGEEAVIERMGRPLRGRETLKPGLHLKWPYPIDVARSHPVERVEMLMVGEQIKEETEGYLWTEAHATLPFHLLVANKEEAEPAAAPKAEGEGEARKQVVPVSMLSGTISVYYTVKHNGLYDYLYNYRNPQATLEALCYRELTRYTVSADFLAFLGQRRGDAGATLKGEIQDKADALKLGVEIVGVSLQGIHPPVEVGKEFEDIAGARQDSLASEHEALAYRDTTVPAARAEANRITLEADAYKERREQVSTATAERFLMRLGIHKLSPRVFANRELLDAMIEGLEGRRKIIKPEWADADETIIFTFDKSTFPTGIDSLLGAPTGGSK
ncbi:protease modulator HflK [Planctomycetota bacterium]